MRFCGFVMIPRIPCMCCASGRSARNCVSVFSRVWTSQKTPRSPTTTTSRASGPRGARCEGGGEAACTHTHINTPYTYTYTYTHTHVNTHTHTYTRSWRVSAVRQTAHSSWDRSGVYAHAQTRIHTQGDTHAFIYTRPHSQKNEQIRALAHTYKHNKKITSGQKISRKSRPRTRRWTHTTRTHAHTQHTHTYTNRRRRVSVARAPSG